MAAIYSIVHNLELSSQVTFSTPERFLLLEKAEREKPLSLVIRYLNQGRPAWLHIGPRKDYSKDLSRVSDQHLSCPIRKFVVTSTKSSRRTNRGSLFPKRNLFPLYNFLIKGATTAFEACFPFFVTNILHNHNKLHFTILRVHLFLLLSLNISP